MHLQYNKFITYRCLIAKSVWYTETEQNSRHDNAYNEDNNFKKLMSPITSEKMKFVKYNTA